MHNGILSILTREYKSAEIIYIKRMLTCCLVSVGCPSVVCVRRGEREKLEAEARERVTQIS
jgi:hypothetical protein